MTNYILGDDSVILWICFLLVGNKDCILEEYLKNTFEYIRGTGGFQIVPFEGIT